MTRTEMKERRKEIENFVDICEIATSDYMKDIILDAVEYKLNEFFSPIFRHNVKDIKKAIKEARRTRNLNLLKKPLEELKHGLNNLL